jgi:hypothetical protein
MPDRSLPELLRVFAINLAPAFMPPTWSVLAFFRLDFGLPLLPLVAGGALASTAGRLALALAGRRWGRRPLGRQRRESLSRLGAWLEARGQSAAPAVLLYSVGPLPSSDLFIAAGLTGRTAAGP